MSEPVFTPENPIEMDCPICHRVWVPTMFDDCLLPACGCFGATLNRDTPCESCGLSHAWKCKGLEGTPKLIEFYPDGTEVHRGIS